MAFFEDMLKIRVTDEMRADVERVLKRSNDKYMSLGHFVRCAINKLVKEEKEGLK